MENSGMEESALLRLIAVLGDTLARLHATIAKEEYGLQQIVASIEFVNRNVDAWANSSQQQVPESPEVHVYESDYSEVSKSIDAILDEARMARATSKPSTSPKGSLSTFCDANIAETPRKSKAAVPKKKLERFSQALRMRPRKTVSSIADAEHSSFFAAQEMLLKWMENKNEGWINAHAERQYRNSSRQSSQCFERKTLEKSSAEKRFLDCLWSIRSIPPEPLTNVEDDNAGGDLNEMGHGNDDSNTTGTENEVQTMTQPMQTNDEVLQAHWRLLNERHLREKPLHAGEDFPSMASSVEEKQCQQHIGNHEKESVAYDDCWLSAEICWKVLGTHAKEIVSKLETQAIPIYYSHVEEALTMMQLMHSIHSNIFHCHLQSLVAPSLLKSSPQLKRRVEDVLSNPSVYLCFRLAHYAVFSNGKALLSTARRIYIS